MKTLVLGLGNPFLSDDSVGLHIARAVGSRLSQPDITVMEASLAGLDLLELLTVYDRVIIIDAIQTGDGEAGQVYRLKPETLAATRHASSPHDVNLATALELGRRLGLTMPEDIIIFGIEVADVTTFSEECTSEVQPAIPLVTDMVVKELTGAASALS